MSPENIVNKAAQLGIHILGITDHNSTKHGPLIKKLAEKKGIFTLCGAEVTTKEETHCLAFFENLDTLQLFQQYLDENLPEIKNNPKYFGDQVVVDEQEMIVEEIDKLLISAINQNIGQVEKKVHTLNGIFIPAHIDRPKYSLVSQLGFVPPDIKADAFEISKFTNVQEITKKFPYIKNCTFIRCSDAHLIENLGSGITIFEMNELSFGEIKMALQSIDGRKAYIEE